MASWLHGGGEPGTSPPHGLPDRESLLALKRKWNERAQLARLGPQLGVRPPGRQRVAECDVPYPSVELRDTTPAPAPEEPHVFFVLYEERAEAPSSSHSPYPARDSASASPAPRDWSTGADLKTAALEAPFYVRAPRPLHALGQAPKRQRYEEWRERHGAYDMAADEAEEEEALRAVSPFLVPRPAVPERRPTPEPAPLPPHALPPGKRWRIPDVRGPDVREPPAYRHDERLADRLADLSKPLSCAVRDPDRTAYAPAETLMTDEEAAASVAAHLADFSRRCPSSRYERILMGLIHPKSTAEFELDKVALESIFSSANEIFFNGRLARRVQWDWSDATSNPQYDNKIIGHTSLRRARGGGFETFILLSTPILRSRAYSRRLLISAFLHELIHCYLFICCGWPARASGGHTDGFRRIADTIDRWAGRENLFLCQVEADLERFRQPPQQAASSSSAPASPSPSPAPPEEYSGYSLASPVFYNERLCCPTASNTDWERCINDRWAHHQDGHHHDYAHGWA